MHRDFKLESEKKWSWPDGYIKVAVDLTRQPTDDYMVVSPTAYVGVAWSNLRHKHAQEAWEFVLDHQQRCLAYYENIASNSELTNLAQCITPWFGTYVMPGHDPLPFWLKFSV